MIVSHDKCNMGVVSWNEANVLPKKHILNMMGIFNFPNMTLSSNRTVCGKF